MARRAITRELYDLLLSAYREAPGNHNHAAKRAAVDYRTAQRGWELGWVPTNVSRSVKDKWIWARPIHEVLQEEHHAVRAERFRMEEEARKKDALERDQSRQDAIKSKAQEAQLVTQARGNVLALQSILTRLIRALLAATGRLEAWLADPNLPPQTAMKAVELISRCLRWATEAGKIVIEIERTRVGDPNDILAPVTGGSEVSTEDAIAELGRINKTLERAKKLGISVLQGGLAQDQSE